MNRRGFMAGILAAGAAPWVCTTAGVLMPVRQIVVPDLDPPMSATEVFERQREYLRDMTERLWAEISANPPLIDHGNGLFTKMLPPDRPWFTLTLTEPDPRARTRVFGGRP